MGIQVQDSRIQTKQPYIGDAKEQIVTNLDQLKIPDNVALQPQNVIPFLASQSSRLNEIVARPDFRSMQGDIPEFHDGMINTVSNVTRDEMAAIQSVSQHIQSQLNLESQDFNPDSLLNEIDRLSGNQTFPDVNQGGQGSAGSVDGPNVLDQMFAQQYRESAEERRRWHEALALAKGNPASVNVIMGLRNAGHLQRQIGKIVEVYAQHSADLDKIHQELTRNANSSTPPNQAEILSASSDLNKASSDMSLISQMLQKSLSDMERITADTKKTDDTIVRTAGTLIQNFKQ
ncbi:MAG: hypothetical protein IPJ69_10150 [Deltaproteobacteria bacterium]|nr:MAG: hypothetical protein IPJ69_10150 [Deltaproteobacteria bacterium]